MGRLRPTLILGGPGCGKTTALLNIVEEAFSRGVQPDRIAFVAFTRKAAEEARERMSEKFGIDVDQIPHFRTLHSFAFQHTDISRAQILDESKLKQYAAAEGLELSETFVDEFGQAIPTPSTDDEMALTAISTAKLTQRPLREVAVEMDLSWEVVKKLDADFREFKAEALVVDFTDMISTFVEKGTCPTLDLLIVDEAQDLSKLQWLMVERLMDNAKDVYFAGDDDQAIYSWAGADVDHFLSLDADKQVLPTSYRLKRNVFTACQKVISNVDTRYPKDWEPYAEGGEVDFVSSLDHVDLATGSWFLLARTNSLVRLFTSYLRAEGFPYLAPTKEGMKSSVDTAPIKAILTYENLRQGKQFSGDKMDLVWHYLRAKIKVRDAPVFDSDQFYCFDDLRLLNKESWLVNLNIPGSVRNYVNHLRGRGESLIKAPRITVSTIHGVKGGEADNVVIMQKLTPRTYGSWVECDPAEYRALFTAMSRAKNRLIFLDAKSRMNYSAERLLQ